MPPRHSAADAGLRRAWPVALVLVALLAIPAPAAAQRDRFYSAVVAFYRSLGALYGDEGPQVLAHLATMTTALARWDRDILDTERELRLRLQTAGDSQTQLEIHTTLASLYIERGRLSDARREIDETIRIDPARAGLHRLRGLVLQMEARDGDAAAEFRAAWLLDPGDPQNAYRAIAYKAAATTTAETERARETLTNLEGALIARDRPAAPAPFTNLSAINDEAGGGTAFVPAAYATGFSSILRGELDRGVDELRAATVSDPLVHDPAARADAMAGGIAALRRGEVAPAIERLETAVAQAPDSSEAHRVLATAYSIAGDIGRSVLHLHEAVRLQPRDERSRLALAQVLIAVDRSAEAQDELRSGVAALPDAAALRWRLSLVSQAHREEEDRALIRMADLLVLLVGKGDLDRELAGLAHLQRDDGTATALLERAVRITPNNATAHKALGRAYVDSGRETEGYAELVAALLIDPEDVETLTALGTWHLTMDQPERSVTALERAVGIAPDNRFAVQALAGALVRAGRREQGQQVLEESERLQAQAIEEDRRLKAAAVLRLNAEMHMRAGEYADAIDVWRQAIRMQPRYAPPHLRLAEALVAANRGEDAVEEYRTAIALGAGPDAHRRLAELYGVLGRPADANRARAAHVAVRLEELRQRAERGVYGF